MKVTVTLTSVLLSSKCRDHLHRTVNVYTKFEEPSSQMHKVIIQIGLYMNEHGKCVNKLKVTVGIICTPKMNICTNLKDLGQFCVCTMFGLYIIKLMVTVILTFNRLIWKSIAIMYTPKRYAKFDKPRSTLCLVIIGTSLGLNVNMLTVTVTFNFDRLSSKPIRITYTLTDRPTDRHSQSNILALHSRGA